MKFLLLLIGITLYCEARQIGPFFSTYQNYAQANSPMPGELVYDKRTQEGLPKRFRSTNNLEQLKNKKNIELAGLMTLRISGSGQFTLGQLRNLYNYLKGQAQVVPDQLIIVDLRQEPHGYINEDAIMFVIAPENALTLAHDIMLQEKHMLERAAALSQVIIYHALKAASGLPMIKIPHVVKVKHVQTEEEAVTAFKSRYIRIPVKDHYRPDDKTVDLFITMLKFVLPTQWLHFKCRGGSGRTTTFMVMYDIIKNPSLTLEKILERHTAFEGKDLTHIYDNEKDWKNGPAKERYIFIKRFYEYVHASKGYNEFSWSSWIRKNYPSEQPQIALIEHD